MAVDKVNIDENVELITFSKDNYARRMLKKTAKAVDNHADEIDKLANMLAPMELIGSYTSPVGESFPTAGIGWSDCTAVEGGSIAGARGLMITIEGVQGASTAYNNKAVAYKILDVNENVIMQCYDQNQQISFELFKMTTDISGEVFGEVSGRKRKQDPFGFFYRTVGLTDGTIIPEESIEIGDFNIQFETNRLTQVTDIIIKIYAQF
jgi:hypothetical protein